MSVEYRQAGKQRTVHWSCGALPVYSFAMKIIRFRDAARFAETAVPVLQEHEAENNLPIGIIENIAAGEYSGNEAFMATVQAGGDTVAAVVVRTPPFPVVVAYTPKAADPDVVGLLVEELGTTYGEEIAGFNADTRVGTSYVDAWSARTGQKPVVHMRLRIYRCRQVARPPDVAGAARTAGEQDAATIHRLMDGFYREALPEEYDPRHIDQIVHRALAADPARRGILLWENAGQVVSMAAYGGPTPRGIRVSAVYTPPEHRRRGYAGACVAALTDGLLRGGREFCFLFTDLSNPTSNRIYQNIGYKPVSDHVYWKFERPA
jgi:hypothetical protein